MRRSPLLPIFLIVLVDVLGFTIVIPLLPLYALQLHATPLVATCLTSVYALCSLLSTPVIGNLSDRFGRKRLLLVSQAGTFGGFIMLAFAGSLWMVFAGRVIDGITAGNLSIAQAYISDHTTPENRAKSFGIIGIAFGLGFMVGPGIGGWLADYEFVLLPSASVPFLVAASLSVLSMIATAVLLSNKPSPGTDTAKAPAGPAGRRPGAFDIATYSEYFGRPKLGRLYVQFFLFTFAFSCFTSGMAIFAAERFDWSARQTGFLFTFSGFLGIIWQGGVIGRLVKKYGEPKLAKIAFVVAVLAYLTISAATTVALIVVAAILSSFGNGVLRPVLTSQITQAVGRHEQGTALGISGSLSSMAMVLGPPAGGLLLDNNLPGVWPLVSAVAITAGLLVALAARKSPDTVAPT